MVPGTLKEGVRIAGRYRLQRRVGLGGLGILWEAKDERSGLPVAVRVLQRGVDDAARVARFRASALSSARLNHSAIARVLDEGHDVEGPFIVTEWVSGTPLSAWRGVRASWAFLGSVMCQLCEALGYVHARGLVHADLRPGNVLIRQGPKGPIVKLTDIGCARIDDGWLDKSAGARATLKFLGSLRYMAPEVADAPPWKIGPWSDLYSFGLILWELLAGAIPFDDKHGVALLLHRSSAPPPPLPEGLGGPRHAALDSLLGRLLATDPAARPPHAAQVRRTLEAMAEPPAWQAPLTTVIHGTQPPTRKDLASAGFPLYPLARAVLQGREEPLRTVWNAVQAVVRGQGSRLVMLSGPAGVGKSQVVEIAAEHAQMMGSAALWKVSFSPSAAPGAALLGCLEDALRAGSTNSRGVADRVAHAELLLGLDARGIEPVVTALLRPDLTPFVRPGNEPDPGIDIGSVGSTHMVAGTFLELLLRASSREAVILWLDDVTHATAAEGLDLVERILADSGAAVCVVATVRAGPAQDAFRARFPTDDTCAWSALPALKGPAIRAYVEARLFLIRADEELVVEAIAKAPALMRPIADFLLDGRLKGGPDGNRILDGVVLPETHHELFRAQLRGLPSDGADTLVPDMVVGLAYARLPLTPKVLEALRAADPNRPLDRALAAAERARLVERLPMGGVRFTDLRLKGWLRGRGADRAESWHRRWLATLRTLERKGRGRLGIERAAHAEALGERQAALAALLDTASWALGPGQQALERGFLAVDRAIHIAEAIGDDLKIARALRLRAELLRQTGERDLGLAALAAVSVLIAPLDAPVEQGWVALTQGWFAIDTLQLDDAFDHFERAGGLFDTASDRGGVLWSYLGYARVASLRDQHRMARTLARRAEEGFTLMGAARGILSAQTLRAAAADKAGDLSTAETRYAGLQALADKRRWLLDGVTIRLHRVRIALAQNRAHEALELMDTARQVAATVRLNRLVEWVDAVRPVVLAATGNMIGARAALGAARLPKARLCPSAAAALHAGLRQATVGLDEALREAIARWAGQVEQAGLPSQVST